MAVMTESATVFRAGGRRWLTRKAAERAEARQIVKARCECCRGDGGVTPPYTCGYHTLPPEKWARMIQLLVVMFVRKQPLPAPPAVAKE